MTSGQITATGDVLPSTSSTYNIGNPTAGAGGTLLQWLNVYSRNFVSDTGVSLNSTANRGLRWNGTTSGEADIGTSSSRFGVAYVTGYNATHLVLDSTGITYQTTGVGAPADGALNIGTSSRKFGTAWINDLRGTATQAKYADLAERYEADAVYAPGTLVRIGGDKEVTIENDIASTEVLGVVSTKPAHLMNSEAGNDQTHPPIAMIGRVHVRCVGEIRKGDRLISAGNGCAMAARNSSGSGAVIGRALANKADQDEGLVESIVKVNL